MVWLNLKFMYNVVLYKKEKIITVVNSFQKKLLLLVNPWERVFESEFAYKSRAKATVGDLFRSPTVGDLTFFFCCL